jgi:hypothetical protein
MAEASRTTKVEIAQSHLAVLILPIAVLFLSEGMLGTFGDTTLTMPPPELTKHARMDELTARYTFLAAFFFFGAVAIASIFIFAADLVSRHTRMSSIRVGIALLAVIAISLTFSTLESEDDSTSFEAYQLLGEPVFATALTQGTLAGCVPGRAIYPECEGQGAFYALTWLLDKANLLSALAAAAVVMGLVLSLARPAAKNDLTTAAGFKAEAAALRESQDNVQRYLYLSGLLLTAGMALGLAWMRWPGEVLADPMMHDDYDALVQSVALFRGVSYSVLILSYYMPVSLLLLVRVRRFNDKLSLSGIKDVEQEAPRFELNRLASLEAMKTVVAILSPILISAVGSSWNISF